MGLTCTLAQINPTTGDVRGNTELILDALDRGAAAGADVVVFPELAITGYCILDLVEDDAFVAANRRALERVRDHTGETAAVVGFVDEDERGRYNAAAVLQHGEVRGIARKVLLPNYRYFDDERYFESGGSVVPISVEVGGRMVDLGVAVCEDMWDGDYGRKPIPELARRGADLIVSVNASPFQTGKRALRHETIQRHIAETGLPFLYVNTVGAADVGRNVVVFDGDSLAYEADGTLYRTGAKFAEDHVTVTVDRSADVTDGPPGALPLVRREAALYEALVLAVRDFTRKLGFERVIVSLSGDIGSALCLAICVEALGPTGVVAYHFPSATSGRRTTAVATELARNFDVEHHVVPVQAIAEAVVATYEDHVSEVEARGATENVHARAKGLLAMVAADDSGPDAPALVVSSGNETEVALGRIVPCGDGDGGLNLLGDLSGSDVAAVATYVNEWYDVEMIPPEAFETRPTAGREPSGESDPVTVSRIVDDIIEGRRSPSEIVGRFECGELDAGRYGLDTEGRTVYERYDTAAFGKIVYDTYERLTASTLERVRAPPVVAVSERAFGTDFREPIINRWDGGVRNHR